MPKSLWAKRQKFAEYSHGLEILDNSCSVQLSMFYYPFSFYKILPYISSVINLQLPFPTFLSPSPSFFTSGGIATGPPGESSNLAVKTSTPSSVTNNVCSNCAVRLPSCVTLVQSSGHVLSLYVPRLIIGSIVNVMPGFAIPIALFFA